ncbi:hypothetical protein [Tenacibaculum maritimum]
MISSTKANDCHTMASFYGINGKKLQRQFKDYLSDFKQWKEKSHAKDWLLFPENNFLLMKSLYLKENSMLL